MLEEKVKEAGLSWWWVEWLPTHTWYIPSKGTKAKHRWKPSRLSIPGDHSTYFHSGRYK